MNEKGKNHISGLSFILKGIATLGIFVPVKLLQHQSMIIRIICQMKVKWLMEKGIFLG
jgi:hypothetical protein